jgi:hypothetical protein
MACVIIITAKSTENPQSLLEGTQAFISIEITHHTLFLPVVITSQASFVFPAFSPI